MGSASLEGVLPEILPTCSHQNDGFEARPTQADGGIHDWRPNPGIARLLGGGYRPMLGPHPQLPYDFSVLAPQLRLDFPLLRPGLRRQIPLNFSHLWR